MKDLKRYVALGLLLVGAVAFALFNSARVGGACIAAALFVEELPA